jgi:two-component system chemotaxis response regulator CheB
VIASESKRLDVGKVYIGEPAQHLTLTANTFGKLTDDPARAYGGRTVDLLFNSVAAHAGKRIIGVVLSGSLDDGGWVSRNSQGWRPFYGSVAKTIAEDGRTG